MKCVKPQGDTTNKIVRSPHTCPLHLAKKGVITLSFESASRERPLKKVQTFSLQIPHSQLCGPATQFKSLGKHWGSLFIFGFSFLSVMSLQVQRISKGLWVHRLSSQLFNDEKDEVIWVVRGGSNILELQRCSFWYLEQEMDWLKCYVKSCTDVSSLAIA